MRTLSGLAATAALTIAAALPCRADELITADGTTHTCEIVSVDAKGVTARGKLKSGEVVEVKIPAARLDPHCWYDLRDKSIGPTDGRARLDLAVWAVEQGLFSRAKIQVRKAAEADPKLAEEIRAGKYPEIREGIARSVLASAESDITAGRFDVARQKVEIVLARLSDTAAGARACDVVRTLDAKQSEAAARQEAEAKAKLDEAARKQADARATLLAAVDADYAKGKAHATDGLTEDDVGKALELLSQALTDGKAALKKLDAIEKDHAADADLVADAKKRRESTVAGMVKVHIHRADLYMWRGSLPNAKEEIDAARKLDPANPEIDAAMQRLLDANDEDTYDVRRAGGRFGGRGGSGGGGRR
jgi:hypothetical protein